MMMNYTNNTNKAVIGRDKNYQKALEKINVEGIVASLDDVHASEFILKQKLHNL